MGEILRKLCEWEDVKILGRVLSHIRMLLEIPPEMSVPSFMGLPGG